MMLYSARGFLRRPWTPDLLLILLMIMILFYKVSWMNWLLHARSRMVTLYPNVPWYNHDIALEKRLRRGLEGKWRTTRLERPVKVVHLRRLDFGSDAFHFPLVSPSGLGPVGPV